MFSFIKKSPYKQIIIGILALIVVIFVSTLISNRVSVVDLGGELDQKIGEMNATYERLKKDTEELQKDFKYFSESITNISLRLEERIKWNNEITRKALDELTDRNILANELEERKKKWDKVMSEEFSAFHTLPIPKDKEIKE